MPRQEIRPRGAGETRTGREFRRCWSELAGASPHDKEGTRRGRSDRRTPGSARSTARANDRLLPRKRRNHGQARATAELPGHRRAQRGRSEEHTSELQSLMRISYAVFCLKKKTDNKRKHNIKEQGGRRE